MCEEKVREREKDIRYHTKGRHIIPDTFFEHIILNQNTE